MPATAPAANPYFSAFCFMYSAMSWQVEKDSQLMLWLVVILGEWRTMQLGKPALPSSSLIRSWCRVGVYSSITEDKAASSCLFTTIPG
jgi:hypothetical protein